MVDDEPFQVPTPQDMEELFEQYRHLSRILERNGFDIPESSHEFLHIYRLLLHQLCNVEEAVAAFKSASVEWRCDHQFAVLPQQILCFFTVDGTANGIRMPTPKRILWRPSRPDYAPDEEQPWLPSIVREVWSNRQLLREHHFFLKSPGGEKYLYAGLGSLTGWSNPFDPHADFHLRKRLPREVWQGFGGYTGWLISIGDNSHNVAPGDLAAFERILTSLSQEDRIYITRYEQDWLSISMNAERASVTYGESDDGNSCSAVDGTVPEDPPSLLQLPGCCELAFEVRLRDTVSRQAGIEALREFFTTGERPRCVAWSR